MELGPARTLAEIKRNTPGAAALIVALSLCAGAVQAGDEQTGRAGQADTADAGAKPAQRAIQRVNDALGVVRQLEAD